MRDKSSKVAVQVVDVTHRFRDVVALDAVSLDVKVGEFVTLLGPSGSGKTTLLRIIAGLTTPTAGSVYIAGRDVSTVAAQNRGVGFVFQNYALFPHLTVFENVAYPLRIRHVKREELRQRVGGALARVNLHAVERRRPSQLSGGQQQRVAVARALVYEPAVLLMDEPLGALDRKLRRHMQLELRQLQQDLEITCIYVTHDQEEALTMSDRIAVMREGHIHQADDPMRLYRHPVDRFVADFIGSTNLFECRFAGRTENGVCFVTVRGTELAVRGLSVTTVHEKAPVYVGVRPEYVRLGKAETLDVNLRTKVIKVTFVGNVVDVICECPSGDRVAAQVPGMRGGEFGIGEEVQIGWNVDDMNVFPTDRQSP